MACSNLKPWSQSVLLQAFVYPLVADYAQRPGCSDNGVAVMVPARELRENLLQELLGHPRIFPPESMLWLGRPPTSTPTSIAWDEVLARELEKQEHQAREALAECKNTRKKHWSPWQMHCSSATWAQSGAT